MSMKLPKLENIFEDDLLEEFVDDVGISLPEYTPIESVDRREEAHSIIEQVLNYDYGESSSSHINIIDEFSETGWVGEFHLDKVLNEAVLFKASDVHLAADREVSFSVGGEILRTPNYPIPDANTMGMVMRGMLTHQEQAHLARELDLDHAYKIRFGPFRGTRLRVSVGLSFGDYFMVFRVIRDDIPSIEELAVEKEIVDWMNYPNGLVLLCGPTGTGKSSTIASVVRDIQLKQKKKIITVEKPIEFVYPDDGLSTLVQRDVGEDVLGFSEGLTAAMRQAPDIIVLGEVRDSSEVNEALRAAETGHLTITTMHTSSVATTINRIKNLFTGEDQSRILSTLADSLRGVGNQVLVRDLRDGRFACREVVTVNADVRKFIELGDVQGLREYQRKHNMTMEYELAKAFASGRCEYREAIKHTSYVDEFREVLQREFNIDYREHED